MIEIAPTEVEVTKVTTYRDGGTVQYASKMGMNFWQDGRIGTKTKNLIYDRHPSEEGARILNVKLKVL